METNIKSELIDRIIVNGTDSSFAAAKLYSSLDANTDGKLTKDVYSNGTLPIGNLRNKFLTGINVEMRLNFSVISWYELLQYNIKPIGIQSISHRLIRFNINDSFNSGVDKRIIPILEEKIKEYNDVDLYSSDSNQEIMSGMLYNILYSCPLGLKLTGFINIDYETLKILYPYLSSSDNPELKQFIDVIKQLPYSEWLTS